MERVLREIARDHFVIKPKAYPVAMELLEQERQKLLRDHYDDGKGICAGCARAVAIRRELEGLAGLHLEV